MIENGDYQIWLTHASGFYTGDGEFVSGEAVNQERWKDEILGRVVEAGDTVMRSGGKTGNASMDGNSDGPHLHFEIRHCVEDGQGGKKCSQPVDPNAVLLPGQDEYCSWNAQDNGYDYSIQMCGAGHPGD